MKTYSTKRQAQFAQLINDLAEDMNLGRWSRKDLMDCINWQQDELCQMAAECDQKNTKILNIMLRAATEAIREF